MPESARDSSRRPSREGRIPIGLLPTAAVAVVLVTAFILLARPEGKQTPWATFRTEDVHSLAFPGAAPDRILFGHHGGLLESRDGGRSWTSMRLRQDAMSTAPASDGSIVVAGHLVFSASADGGTTWRPIATELPDLDIHGFTRDPGDPKRMWAYVASGGLWESTDAGARFVRVRQDNVLFPLAVRRPDGVRLLGVDATGLIASDDGGRNWVGLGLPPTAPITAFGATPDGRIVYLGSPDGLFRSDDGGEVWRATRYKGSVFAVATTPDGERVALVNRATELFLSSDGGATWPGP